MAKKILLVFFVIIMLGILVPLVFQQFNPLQTEVAENYRSAYEPMGGLLLAAKQVDRNENYLSHCNSEHKSIIVKTYSWMMIPGPTLEACMVVDKQESIMGIKNFGVVEKK